MHGVGVPMRAISLLAFAMGCTSCASPSYGTPADCAAAGGQCAIGGGIGCVKQGPENTCNCNPGCNPGGAICCVQFVDAGDGG